MYTHTHIYIYTYTDTRPSTISVTHIHPCMCYRYAACVQRRWKADEAMGVHRVGWNVCFTFGDSEDVNTTTTTTMTTTTRDPFVLRLSSTGPCVVTDNCVTSPHYPSSSQHDESCLIVTNPGNQLTFSAFSTEAGYDTFVIDEWLTLSGELNAESYGPGVEPVYTTDSGSMAWKTDSSGSSQGWKVCFAEGEGDFEAGLETPGVNLCSASESLCCNGQCVSTSYIGDSDNDCGDGSDETFPPFQCYGGESGDAYDAVVSATFNVGVMGDCQQRDGAPNCVHSNGFVDDDNYGDNEECSVTVPAGSRVWMQSFATEANYDMLTINNIAYSGSDLDFESDDGSDQIISIDGKVCGIDSGGGVLFLFLFLFLFLIPCLFLCSVSFISFPFSFCLSLSFFSFFFFVEVL